MKTIDINNIEDGYKIETLQKLLALKGEELISIQATANEILDVSNDDISIIVKYLNGELTIFVGDHKTMKGVVENGEI
ncbi:hypothetical protein [Enterobacter hormaechei]